MVSTLLGVTPRWVQPPLVNACSVFKAAPFEKWGSVALPTENSIRYYVPRMNSIVVPRSNNEEEGRDVRSIRCGWENPQAGHSGKLTTLVPELYIWMYKFEFLIRCIDRAPAPMNKLSLLPRDGPTVSSFVFINKSHLSKEQMTNDHEIIV